MKALSAVENSGFQATAAPRFCQEVFTFCGAWHRTRRSLGVEARLSGAENLAEARRVAIARMFSSVADDQRKIGAQILRFSLLSAVEGDLHEPSRSHVEFRHAGLSEVARGGRQL